MATECPNCTGVKMNDANLKAFMSDSGIETFNPVKMGWRTGMTALRFGARGVEALAGDSRTDHQIMQCPSCRSFGLKCLKCKTIWLTRSQPKLAEKSKCPDCKSDGYIIYKHDGDS